VELTLIEGRRDPEVAATLSQGWGRVSEFDAVTGTVKIELTAGRTLSAAVKALSARPSTSHVEALVPPAPAGLRLEPSVSKSERWVAEYKAAYIDYLASRGEEPEDEIPGLDFMEAYLFFKRDRAFPNDTYDAAYVMKQALDRAGWSNGGPPPPGAGPTENWEFIGPQDLNVPYRTYYGLRSNNGRVNAVAFDPIDSDTLYIGAPQGGVWKTTDGGINWTPLSDTWPNLGVSALAVDPQNPDTIYAGTGDYHGFDVTGYGLQKSTDGGATWTIMGASDFGFSRISDIVINPDNSTQLVVSCGRSGGGTGYGVYRSTDSGSTWTRVRLVKQDHLRAAEPAATSTQFGLARPLG
jgi:hypothetical protein